MAITLLPTPPKRTDPPDTFIANGDALLGALPQFVIDANTLAANLNSIAAGGAYAIPYVYDTIVNVGTSTGGKLTVSPTLSAPTQLYMDTKNASGKTVTALLADFNASSSSVRGTARVQKTTDASKWAVYAVTGYAVNGGGLYGVATIALVSASDSNPFSAGDSVMLFFQRTGDKGDTPPVQTPILHVRGEAASGTSGGTGTSGTYVVRQINTVKKNSITNATLSSNVVSVPAGTYRIRAIALAGCTGAHSAYLNIGGTLYYGTSGVGSGGSTTTSIAVNVMDVVLSGQTSITLYHKINTAQTSSDFGAACSPGSPGVEVYVDMTVEKVA